MVSIRIGLRSLWQNNHETTRSWGWIKPALLLMVFFLCFPAQAEIALGKRFFDLKAARNGGTVASQVSLNKGTFMRLGNYKPGGMPIPTRMTADRTAARAVQLASLPLINDSIEQKAQPERAERAARSGPAARAWRS